MYMLERVAEKWNLYDGYRVAGNSMRVSIKIVFSIRHSFTSTASQCALKWTKAVSDEKKFTDFCMISVIYYAILTTATSKWKRGKAILR